MEKLPFLSAEKRYELDGFEVRAVSFAHDPIVFMKTMRDRLLADAAYASENVAWDLIDEYSSLVMTIDGDPQLSAYPNEDLQRILHADSEYENTRIMFEVLQSAGVTYSELLTWVQVESGETSEEVLVDRGYRVLLREVYGE